MIEKHEQPSSEAFQSIVGKEKPGRLRCHGRTTTPTLLKRNQEIAKLKREHADEVKQLMQEMEEKRRQDKEASERKFQLLFNAIVNQNTANLDIEAIAACISAPTVDANRSSTSTHAPNDNEVRLNYIFCLIQHIIVYMIQLNCIGVIVNLCCYNWFCMSIIFSDLNFFVMVRLDWNCVDLSLVVWLCFVVF
jgi:cytochrome c553